MHRADAEIGPRRAPGRLTRQRQRRKIADPLIARAPQSVELRRDAEALLPWSLGSISLGGRNRQRARDAVYHQTMTADRQGGQRHGSLGEDAPVGERPLRAVALFDAPLAHAPVLAFDPTFARLRMIAQRRDERLVDAKHE